MLTGHALMNTVLCPELKTAGSGLYVSEPGHDFTVLGVTPETARHPGTSLFNFECTSQGPCSSRALLDVRSSSCSC